MASLVLEVPTSPSQPSVAAENNSVDVWPSVDFPPQAGGKNVRDGRDKWIVSSGDVGLASHELAGDQVHFELQSAVASKNRSAPKCLTFYDYKPGQSDIAADVVVADCAKCASPRIPNGRP